MADRFIRLSGLNAEAMLGLLAAVVAAPAVDARSTELLQTCRIVIGDAVHDLYLNQSTGGPWAKECQQFHKKLTDLYSDKIGSNISSVNRIDGVGLAVELAACVLLQLCRGPQAPDPERHLLVGVNLPTERIRELLTMLQSVATEAKAALMKNASRTGDVTSYAAFDVYADRTRYAAVSALIAGNAFSDCTLLEKFGNRYGSVFLALPALQSEWSQSAVGLNAQSLDNFLRLVRSSPPSFGLPNTSDERRLAIVPAPGAGFHILPLSGQTFQHLWRGLGSTEANAEMVELAADEAAMRRLEQNLAGGSVAVGYRLTLQPNYRRRLKDEQHIQKIRAQREKLDQDLAYNWNMGMVRPKLWRFAQSQLSAMIDALCSFPMQDLKSGRILYGYAATRRHPSGEARPDYALTPDSAEGVHYLYISQDAFMADGNPLAYWESNLARLNPTIRYWLDPFWARFYHPANQALVFVPEGTVLSPPIHSAAVEDMDGYLRATLPRWFPGAFPGGTVTARKPIYLFDGYTAGNRPIFVTVLDLAAFRPPTAEIGWLNDNLLLMETLDVHRLITQMADDAGRTRLAQSIQDERSRAIDELNRAAAALSAELAAKTAELTHVLTEELQVSLQAADKTVEDIQTLDRQLNQYRAVYAQMQALHTQSEAFLKDLLAAESDLDQRIHNLETNVKSSVAAAEATRKRLEQEVEQQARRAESTYKQLAAKIDGLK